MRASDGADEAEARRLARVRNWFNSGEDFFKLREWPDYLQQMALKKHKSYRERYRLFLFFVANGLNPSQALNWVSLKDVVNGDLVFETYDAAAWAQMQAAYNDARSGKIYVGRNWFDMTLGRVVYG